MSNFLSNFFKASNGREEESSRFSDFFAHASEDEQIRVLTEVAKKANEDQLEVFRKANIGDGV